MSQQHLRNARTAALDGSIWLDIPEATFRKHLVTLEEKTNAIPVPPQVFSLSDCKLVKDAKARILPLEAEQRLADDLAYIVAVGEGAQSVSAVCIEEHSSPCELLFRIAAVDSIHDQLRDSLRQISQILSQSAMLDDLPDTTPSSSSLCQIIVKLHRQKLLGRLRSSRWKKPKYLSAIHKKPLWQDFSNLIHRVQFVYPKRKDTRRFVVERQLQELAKIFEDFESIATDSEAEFDYLLRLIEASYHFCLSPEIQRFAQQLESLPRITSQIAAALKALRQIEKIGAYRRIAVDLVTLAGKYQSLFRSIHFEYLVPYSATNTDIGYEEWAKTLHVHAEIQLIVYYDSTYHQNKPSLESSASRLHLPRLIGTSKYLCYLCYLFIKYHGEFIPTNTHGRLYDQWTIPDLVEFNENLVHRYKGLIGEIDTHIVSAANEIGSRTGKRESWRVEPMTSRQNLLSLPGELVESKQKNGTPTSSESIDSCTQDLTIEDGDHTLSSDKCC